MKKILFMLFMLFSMNGFAGSVLVDASTVKDVVLKDAWQQLDYEYYTLEVPAGWVFRFGGEDKASIHKRNIRIKNDKGARVEYELGTLTWETEQKNSDDSDKLMSVNIRSFRKTSGEAAFMDEVGGKIAEASWPDYLKIVTEENGGSKGSRWNLFLLKGEAQGFSVTEGSFTKLVWNYMYFVEKGGMVYCVTVKMPDAVRSSSPKYDKLARRIVKSFKVK